MTRDLVLTLDRYAASVEPPPPWWLSGGDADPSIVYCRGCVEKAVAQNPDAEIDGGFTCEEDGCQHCETCGRLLSYTLTDYGAREEIDHYSRVRFRKPLNKGDAYHVARMLAAAEDDKHAVAIARRAVRAITPKSEP